MTLGLVESMTLLIIALFAVIILLRILMVVHGQNGKVKELEMRMKAMENMDAEVPTDTNDSTDNTEK